MEICEDNLFPSGRQDGSCHVFIKDKVVNLGHDDKMQVSCTLFVQGSSNFIEIFISSTGWPNEIETNLRMKYFTN